MIYHWTPRLVNGYSSHDLTSSAINNDVIYHSPVKFQFSNDR